MEVSPEPYAFLAFHFSVLFSNFSGLKTKTKKTNGKPIFQTEVTKNLKNKKTLYFNTFGREVSHPGVGQESRKLFCVFGVLFKGCFVTLVRNIGFP